MWPLQCTVRYILVCMYVQTYSTAYPYTLLRSTNYRSIGLQYFYIITPKKIALTVKKIVLLTLHTISAITSAGKLHSIVHILSTVRKQMGGKGFFVSQQLPQHQFIHYLG